MTTLPQERITVRPIQVNVESANNNAPSSGVQVSGNNWSIAITSTAQGVQPTANENNNRPVIETGGKITTFGTGFKPNSQVDFFAYSTPLWLGSALTDSKGNYSVTLPIPSSLAEGNHVFQAQGMTKDNVQRVANIPITIVSRASGTNKKLDVYFQMNSVSLDAKAQRAITNAYKSVKSKLSSKSMVRVEVTGWVQPTKNSPNIKQLSTGRAKAVVDYLKKLGLKAQYVIKAPGHDKLNDASSRRASIQIKWSNPKK